MKPNTRDTIIAAALDLFYSRGYTATGVLDITKAAGVPKGSFYHFFPSKEALAEATVIAYTKNNRIELLTDSSPSPLQRIHNHIDYLLDFAERDGYVRGCLFGNFSTEMPSQSDLVSRAVAAALDNWVKQLTLTIIAAKEAGEITTNSDPARLATHIVASIEGSLSQSKVSRSSAPLELTITTIFTDLLY
ncbi:TetR family transcriptional regulator C-terminal domain-containing protein [Paenibacillus qinlingensis]|uniref:TetR/AcrR family transcriptional repressor of nem operon n=1 Tax=Paenibacillus qinlingensis TaxID=1837343 RepID=A0ABU1P5L9_9BACL|nr:TetR family transcriptional regulator C-terminal domain-containing protein [Paenibacillus qinlingensis]MDR6554839.1 TetR/AcrR family transcriptional repressor of nem operon [Paenibacillus qinlingensis]